MNKQKNTCNLLTAIILSGVMLQISSVNVLASYTQRDNMRIEQKLSHSNGLVQYNYSDGSFKNLQYIDLLESTNLKITDSSTKSVKWVGYLTPDETGSFIFDANGGYVFINGMPVLSNGQAHPINMEKGKYYEIEIRCNLENEQGKDPIKLYWSLNRGEKVQISLKNIKSTVDKTDLPRQSRMRTALGEEDLTDNDQDGIPDELEMNGVAYFRGKLYAADADAIKQYVDNGQIKIYKTSPNAMSTDGDPFTDLDEIKKTSIVKSETNGLGSNPLVAAAPIIRLNVKNVSITPNGQMSFSDGSTFTSSISNSVTTTEVNDITHSNNMGFSLSKLFTFSFGYSRDVKESTSVARAEINGMNLGYDFRTATTLNSAEAAYLALEMEYQNIGTAVAHNVNPNFSIKLGNDTIFTVQPSDNTNEQLLEPNETSIIKHIGYFGSKDQKIPLSISQLQRIKDGEKITIIYDQDEIAGQALLKFNPDQLVSWSNYFSGMSQGAEIGLRVGNKQVQRLNIYAGGKNAFINGDPEITLKEGLERLYNLRKEGDKTLISYIDENGFKKDVQVNDNMIIAFDRNTAESIKVQLSNNDDVNTVKLSPGMNIVLSTIESEVEVKVLPINKEMSLTDLNTKENRQNIIDEIEGQINYPIQNLKINLDIQGLYSNIPFSWGGYHITFDRGPIGYQEYRNSTQVGFATETIEISKENFLDGNPSLEGNTLSDADFKRGTQIDQYTGEYNRMPATNGKIINTVKVKIIGVVADTSTNIH